MTFMQSKYRFHVTLVFLLFIVSGHKDDENTMIVDNQRQTESKMPIIEAVKTLFSLPTTSGLWIHRIKPIFQQGWQYFSPPNLDFRRVGGGEEGTAAEKVKEAAVKSLDKSKTTIENSAKSAAQFAEEAVDQTVNKLKKTLSDKVAPHQLEL